MLKILRITALFFAPACFIIWTLIKLNKENLLKNTNRTFAVGRRLWVLFVFSPFKYFYCNITVNFICWKALFLKNLVNFFCFWEDNLALAKFQCPTDTPLNHNLLMLTFRTERKKQKNKNHCKNAAVFKNMTVSVSRVLSWTAIYLGSPLPELLNATS